MYVTIFKSIKFDFKKEESVGKKYYGTSGEN